MINSCHDNLIILVIVKVATKDKNGGRKILSCFLTFLSPTTTTHQFFIPASCFTSTVGSNIVVTTAHFLHISSSELRGYSLYEIAEVEPLLLKGRGPW